LKNRQQKTTDRKTDNSRKQTEKQMKPTTDRKTDNSRQQTEKQMTSDNRQKNR